MRETSSKLNAPPPWSRSSSILPRAVATLSHVWKTIREEFKSAHTAAQEAGNAGPLGPRSRLKLQEFVKGGLAEVLI